MASRSKAVLKWGATQVGVAKVVAIKDFPDLGGDPEVLDASTLEDDVQVSVLGIQALDALAFTANYSKTDFTAVDDDANTDMYYSLELGESGADGIYEWQGQHVVYVVGKGVNEVMEMKIVVVPSTAPTLKTS